MHARLKYCGFHLEIRNSSSAFFGLTANVVQLTNSISSCRSVVYRVAVGVNERTDSTF